MLENMNGIRDRKCLRESGQGRQTAPLAIAKPIYMYINLYNVILGHHSPKQYF